MRTQIIIFLGFVSVAVFVNAMVILFTYKVFAGMAAKITDSIREFGGAGNAREWLAKIQTASEQAVELTTNVKEQLELSGPRLAEVQSTLGYGLAKIDVRFGRFCDGVSSEASKAQAAVITPTRRLGAAATAFLRFLAMMGFDEGSDDVTAGSKRR